MTGISDQSSAGSCFNIVGSHKVSKPRDLYLELCDRSEIWQAPRQQCCRRACQMSKRLNNLNCQSRGFKTSRDLTIRRFIGYWNRALVMNVFGYARFAPGILKAVIWYELHFRSADFYSFHFCQFGNHHQCCCRDRRKLKGHSPMNEVLRGSEILFQKRLANPPRETTLKCDC